MTAPDFESINGALGSLRLIRDIIIGWQSSDKILDKAETKLRLASLMEPLAEAKTQLAEVKMLLVDKDDEIARLKQSLTFKGNLVRHENVYFETDEAGTRIGSPICSRCWEVEHRLIHIVVPDGGGDTCPQCKTQYKPIEWQVF